MFTRLTPVLFGAAAVSVFALVGCQNDEPAHHHHARTTDIRYDDPSQTAGERIERDTVYHDRDAGLQTSEPGTAGTRAPTQSARPDPLIDAPRDPSGH